jgi:hypothetical protein
MRADQDTQDVPDFARGLFVCSKPGYEFASAASSAGIVPFVLTQSFAALFIIPVAVFFVLRNMAGAATWVAGTAAGVLGAAVLTVGIIVLVNMNRSNYKGGGFFRNESDSRYRVRAVIPKKRRSDRVMRWVKAATHGEFREEEEVTEADLESVLGGFDPIIVRPWFGVRRERAYWWTAVLCGFACAGMLLGLLTLIMGGWSGVLKNSGFLGYAMTGAGMVSGVVCAELIWPVYVRVVPGRLDLFVYGFLGSGEAEVETHDLKRQGVCVDFGTYTIALEPERPIGEALPALVKSKHWPYGQALPEDYRPRYVCMGLVVGRRDIAERVIQGARTDEATPPVSETELMG